MTHDEHNATAPVLGTLNLQSALLPASVGLLFGAAAPEAGRVAPISAQVLNLTPDPEAAAADPNQT